MKQPIKTRDRMKRINWPRCSHVHQEGGEVVRCQGQARYRLGLGRLAVIYLCQEHGLALTRHEFEEAGK